ncbi:MAG: HEAT repeat domain-containing protein [Kineosporiaceae bacterium]
MQVGRAAVLELARIAREGTAAEIEWADAWLSRLDGVGWLRLDEEARRFSYVDGGRPVGGVQGWLGASAGESSGVVAAVTSLHQDGRFRQRGVQILSGRLGYLRARALAVRCLDHVPEVRDDALLGLRVQVMSGKGFEAAADVLLAGRDRQHAPSALAQILASVESTNTRADAVRRLLAAPLRRLRLWALELGGAEVLDVPELVTVVTADPDQAVRRAGMTHLGRRASSAQLRPLLRARFVDARVLAMAGVTDANLPDAVIRVGLLDPAARVRAESLVRARRRGLDVAAHYRDALERAAREHDGGDRNGGRGVVAAALTGLGTHGSGRDLDLIGRWLIDPRPGPRAAAVTAYAHLADSEQVTATLTSLLHDPSPKVTAAAARAIAAIRVPADEDTLETAWSSQQPWTRRAAWRITRSRGGWSRVDADIRAAVDLDNDLGGLGANALRGWLDNGAATTWGRPNAAQAARIAHTLNTHDLPDDVAIQVAFHAGLPRPRPLTRAAPDPHDTALADERSRWRALRERLLPHKRTRPAR